MYPLGTYGTGGTENCVDGTIGYPEGWSVQVRYRILLKVNGVGGIRSHGLSKQSGWSGLARPLFRRLKVWVHILNTCDVVRI